MARGAKPSKAAKSNGAFYLVREEILPKSIKKTILAKEMVQRGEVRTVNEAVYKAKISRSAYYKYKDFVFSFYEATQSRTVTIGVKFSYKTGAIAEILQAITAEGATVLTINQSLPVQGAAQVDIMTETLNMTSDIEVLMKKLREIKGVKKAEIIGKS